ncbi:MAG TPA: hypothetical protein VHU83_24850 [Bryobacteraceae bacterium]|nr:hypothetical protein [Bryobacteraceae bacterium]
MLNTGFFNSAESVVTYAATLAEILLLVRLTRLKLIRELPIFWSFLAFDAIRTLALVGRDYHSVPYELIWTTTAPIWTLMLALVAVELMRGLVKPVPGEPVSRAAAVFGFLLGMTGAAVASMILHPEVVIRPMSLLAFMGQRCITSGCIIAVLAQGFMLAIGGAPLIRNWRRHRRVLLVFTTAIAIGSATATSTHGNLAAWVGLLRDVALLACYCAWVPVFERAWSHVYFPSPSRFHTLAESEYARESPSGEEWKSEICELLWHPMSEDTIAENIAYGAQEAKRVRKATARMLKALS